MSDIEKRCAYLKKSDMVGNSGQLLYICEGRDDVDTLGITAKVCFVCDDYRSGKEIYDEKIRQEIVDHLSGKRKRQAKRWTKKRKTTTKTTRKKKKDEDEEEEEEEEEEEADVGDDVEEDAEEEEEDVEDEDEEEVVKEKKKTAPKKKAATKKKPTTTKAPAPEPESVEIEFTDDDNEILNVIKSKGKEGITQLDLKNEVNMPSSKISKILNKLSSSGHIIKEKAKVKNEKTNRIINTNLLIAKE
ncbi:MAG: helix-turn-helix transcriptional regulator [Candidatus Hodarchaeota archaeon]